jgi:hypothetical protein
VGVATVCVHPWALPVGVGIAFPSDLEIETCGGGRLQGWHVVVAGDSILSSFATCISDVFSPRSSNPMLGACH